uniref:Uncharacterized protein n=2 Tax=prokaryotic environmental samples TaxID=81490 RepID=B3T5D7_9ZZZZ|nr:hypothetical protein ALOHA_HF4000ANIW133F6ctg1g4 [uncultured marine microorganism HF4000_ANIW133F6]ABZ07796.1 hypothetical protein ALOHA_HF4000ANIW141C7ctg1g30 [uncultured marine microorganism HF4000_ANIW141C7]
MLPRRPHHIALGHQIPARSPRLSHRSRGRTTSRPLDRCCQRMIRTFARYEPMNCPSKSMSRRYLFHPLRQSEDDHV